MRSLHVCVAFLFLAAAVAAQRLNDCYNMDELRKTIRQCEDEKRNDQGVGGQPPFGGERRPNFGDWWSGNGDRNPDVGVEQGPGWSQGAQPWERPGGSQGGGSWRPGGNQGRGPRGPGGNQEQGPWGQGGNQGQGSWGPNENQGQGPRGPGGNQGQGPRGPGGNQGRGPRGPGGPGRRPNFNLRNCWMEAFTGVRNNNATIDFAGIKQYLPTVANAENAAILQNAVDDCSSGYGQTQDGQNRDIPTQNRDYEFCFMRQMMQSCTRQPGGGTTDGGNPNGGAVDGGNTGSGTVDGGNTNGNINVDGGTNP